MGFRAIFDASRDFVFACVMLLTSCETRRGNFQAISNHAGADAAYAVQVRCGAPITAISSLHMDGSYHHLPTPI